MRQLPRIPLLLIAATALLGCDASEPVAPRPAFEIDLTEGQTVLVGDRKLSIDFVAVLEDNRCPMGMQCFEAGSATVELTLKSGMYDGWMKLKTEPAASSGDFAGFHITLLELTPVGPVGPLPHRARLEVVSTPN